MTMTTERRLCKARDTALRVLRDRHRGEYDEIFRAEMGYTARPCCVCGADVWTELRRSCGDPFCVEAQTALRKISAARRLRPGSRVHELAVDCARRVLPIVAEFPQEIRDQIAAELRGDQP